MLVEVFSQEQPEANSFSQELPIGKYKLKPLSHEMPLALKLCRNDEIKGITLPKPSIPDHACFVFVEPVGYFRVNLFIDEKYCIQRVAMSSLSSTIPLCP